MISYPNKMAVTEPVIVEHHHATAVCTIRFEDCMDVEAIMEKCQKRWGSGELHIDGNKWTWRLTDADASAT